MYTDLTLLSDKPCTAIHDQIDVSNFGVIHSACYYKAERDAVSTAVYRNYSFHFSDIPCVLIIYGSNIYRCCNVPLGGRFVGPFGTRLTCTRLADLQSSIWIFPLLDPRMESELSLRLHAKTIEFDNAGYFIPVRHDHCDS